MATTKKLMEKVASEEDIDIQNIYRAMIELAPNILRDNSAWLSESSRGINAVFENKKVLKCFLKDLKTFEEMPSAIVPCHKTEYTDAKRGYWRLSVDLLNPPPKKQITEILPLNPAEFMVEQGREIISPDFKLNIPRDIFWRIIRKQCAKCGANNPEKKCGNCKFVLYCNGACQNADWKFHKKHCKSRSFGG